MAKGKADAEKGDGPDDEQEAKSPLTVCVDCCATCIRGIVVFFKAIIQSIIWCLRRTCYPIKERMYACFDRVDKRLHPYKAKKAVGPGTSTFGYDGINPKF